MKPSTSAYTLLLPLLSTPTHSAPAPANNINTARGITSSRPQTFPNFSVVKPFEDPTPNTEDPPSVSDVSDVSDTDSSGLTFNLIFHYTFITTAPTTTSNPPAGADYATHLTQALQNVKTTSLVAASAEPSSGSSFNAVASRTFAPYGPVQIRIVVPEDHDDAMPQSVIVRLVEDIEAHRSSGQIPPEAMFHAEVILRENEEGRTELMATLEVGLVG